MRNLPRLERTVPTVVFTGYQSFEGESGIITLENLEKSMHDEFGCSLLAVIQCAPFSSNWISKLQRIYKKRELLA